MPVAGQSREAAIDRPAWSRFRTKMRNRLVKSSQSQSPRKYDSATDRVPPSTACRKKCGRWTCRVAFKSSGCPTDNNPLASRTVISPRLSPASCAVTIRRATRSTKPIGDATVDLVNNTELM